MASSLIRSTLHSCKCDFMWTENQALVLLGSNTAPSLRSTSMEVSTHPLPPSQFYDHSIDTNLFYRTRHKPCTRSDTNLHCLTGRLSWVRVHIGTLSGRSWLNLSKPLSPATAISLFISVRGLLHTMAAHAIPVDLLMDLIAFQLIAPHANTKLNQTEVPSTSLIASLIPLDIIIRWYWLLMTQQFQNRWVSARPSPWRDRRSRSGHVRVQVALLQSAVHCVLVDNMLVTLSVATHYALLHTGLRDSKHWHTQGIDAAVTSASVVSLLWPLLAMRVPSWVHLPKLLGSKSKLIKHVT